MSAETKEEALIKAQQKVEYKGFFGENTVEVAFPDGTKRRVNKFEADVLKSKLKKSK